MRRTLLALTILTVAGPAHADPCADARAEVKHKDLARASIDAAACGDEALLADVEARAEKAGYSPVEVVTEPTGGTVVVEPAPDRPFTAPLRVWLPPGRYTVTALVDGQPVAETTAVAKDGNRTSALLDLPAPRDPSSTGVVDMGEEGGGEMTSGPPPKVVLPSLLPERYQAGVDAKEAWVERDVHIPRRWQASIGIQGARDGIGAIVEVERFWGRQAWVIAPVLAASVLRFAGTTAVQGHAAALVQHRGRRVQVGLGPSVVATAGGNRGVSAGALVAAALLGHGDMSYGLRFEAPAVTTGDHRLFELAAYIGMRW